MKSLNWVLVVKGPIFVLLLVLCSSKVFSIAPPTNHHRIAPAKYEGGGGSDYLALEEDDEFPEESIAFLRSMAQSFRGGFAKALNQGSTPSPSEEANPKPSGSEEEADDSGEKKPAPPSMIMTYINEIVKGFQAIGKSIGDMFRAIASKGGEKLAERVQVRLTKWAERAPSTTPPADAAKKQSPAPESPASEGDPPSEPKPF